MTPLILSLKTAVYMMMHCHLVSSADLLEMQHPFQNPSLNIIHLCVYFRENDGGPDFPIRQNVLHSFPLPSKVSRNNMAGLNLETLAQSFSAVARRFRATPISVYTNPLCLLSLEGRYSQPCLLHCHFLPRNPSLLLWVFFSPSLRNLTNTPRGVLLCMLTLGLITAPLCNARKSFTRINKHDFCLQVR